MWFWVLNFTYNLNTRIFFVNYTTMFGLQEWRIFCRYFPSGISANFHLAISIWQCPPSDLYSALMQANNKSSPNPLMPVKYIVKGFG